MTKKQLIKKEKEFISELIAKALDSNRPSLTEKEVKELHRLLKLLGEIEEEQKKASSKTVLSEVIDTKITRKLAEKAYYEQHTKKFGKSL